MVDAGIGPRRGGALWWVLAAVLSALVAGYVAVRAVTAARRETPVVIARADVPPLTRVTGADVAVVQMPAAALPAGALRTTTAAVGHFTRMGLVPGEMLTAAALGGGVSRASGFDVRLARLAGVADCAKAPAVPVAAAARTRPSRVKHAAGQAAHHGAAAGHRSPTADPRSTVACRDLVAMALPASADQGFQLIHSGDRVDVAATYPLQRGTVAQIVAANVPVMARIGNAQGAAPTIPGSRAAALGPSSGWLILGLPPATALRVHLAETAGKIAVFLQPPGAPAQPSAVTANVISPNSLAASAHPTAPAVAGQFSQGAPLGGAAGGPRG